MTGGRAALTSALGVLRRGGVVGVFPEGNRGRGDATSARAGIAWLALNGHAPVVPVAVLGTRRTGESVNHVPGLRRRLAIEFGEPLVVERAAGTSGRVALVQANEAIRVALAELVDSAVGPHRAGAADRRPEPRTRALTRGAGDRQWDPSAVRGHGRALRGRVACRTRRSSRTPLRDALGLDGTGRLLDVGCGPGSLTILLAPLFAAAVGVDAGRRDGRGGRRCGERRPSSGGSCAAEELPADLGIFRVVVFAQSFHWMDQALVADRVRGMLERGRRLGARGRDDAPRCRGR